jgi:hypothetical protein
MDEKLTAIIARIEYSSLPNEEKNLLYRIISDALYATVWPTLIIHMPDHKLKALFDKKNDVKPDEFADIILTAAKAVGVWDMVMAKMIEVLEDTEKTLDEQKIPKVQI